MSLGKKKKKRTLVQILVLLTLWRFLERLIPRRPRKQQASHPRSLSGLQVIGTEIAIESLNINVLNLQSYTQVCMQGLRRGHQRGETMQASAQELRPRLPFQVRSSMEFV